MSIQEKRLLKKLSYLRLVYKFGSAIEGQDSERLSLPQGRATFPLPCPPPQVLESPVTPPRPPSSREVNPDTSGPRTRISTMAIVKKRLEWANITTLETGELETCLQKWSPPTCLGPVQQLNCKNILYLEAVWEVQVTQVTVVVMVSSALLLVKTNILVS